MFFSAGNAALRGGGSVRFIPDSALRTSHYVIMFIMENINPIPSRFAVIWNPSVREAWPLAEEISDELRNRNADVVEAFSLDDYASRQEITDGAFDMMIALGGDGTMLRAGKLGAHSRTPVMGVNLGHFGFLMDVNSTEWRERVNDLLSGTYQIDRRMMMCADHLDRDGKLLRSVEVLNDLVLARGMSMRPVHLTVKINDIELAEYVADGLILSTATGSSAYSRSVGGAILRPDMREMLLTPIAPVWCVDRCLILPETDIVHIMVGGNVETIFSPDGQEGVRVEKGEQLIARASEDNAWFVRFGDKGAFYRKVTALMQRNPSIGKDY